MKKIDLNKGWSLAGIYTKSLVDVKKIAATKSKANKDIEYVIIPKTFATGSKGFEIWSRIKSSYIVTTI